ncbi:MAG: RNA polymerase sigma factor [Candidatus Latescibacterota bacterium]
MTDTDLMMRVKSGDKGAFRCIVETYRRRVINVGYRILGNREDAEDVAQETFLKLYLSAGKYQPKAELFTYLYTIATRLALNRLRRRKRLGWFSLDQLQAPKEDGPGLEFPSEPADQPDVSLEQKEREEVVRRALDTLPAAQKIAVVLSRYEELSYSQIAKVMDISVSAVESKLHRAKQSLKKRLGGYMA